MNDQRKQFIELLQKDSKLLKMLATNKAFWNEGLDPSKKFSIVPVDKGSDRMNTPFISVQVSADNLLGNNLSDVFIYVRCYNRTDKTFVDIDKVLSRVKVLLQSHRFDQYADNAVSIDTVYESTGPDSTDQGYNLNYRESRYRVLYL